MTAKAFHPGVSFGRGQLARLLGVERKRIRRVPGVLDEVETRRGTRFEFKRPFLTRTQAAKKLRKSRTAVIAVEGTLLHPELGPGDVRLFDVDDVDRLVGKPFGIAAHSRWFKRTAEAQKVGSNRQSTESSTSSAANELQRLHRAVIQLRAMLVEQIDTWRLVDRSRAQPRVRRKVDEMLAAHRKALGID